MTHINCPYCSCTFFTQEDLDAHIETFGNKKYEHRQNLIKTHMFDRIPKKEQKKKTSELTRLKLKLEKASNNENQEKLT